MRTKIILVTGILAFMGLLSSCRDSSSSPQEKKASKSNSAVVNDAAFTGGGDVRPLTEGRLGARERELDDKMPMNASAADDAKTEERFVDQLASKCVGFFNNRESQMGLVVIDDPPRVEVTFTDALGTPFARATPTKSGFVFDGAAGGGVEGRHRVECHDTHLSVIPPSGSYLGSARSASRDTVGIHEAGSRDGWYQAH